MRFKISGAFFKMSEPEGMVINMSQGMESYILLRFYEPMVITVNGKTTVTRENACIIFSPHASRQYRAIRGGFTNDYVSFIADEAFVRRYILPINSIFYVDDPQQLSSCIGYITWALTDVLYDHSKLIEEQTSAALMYIQGNIISLPRPDVWEDSVHEHYVALRNEVQTDPSLWTVEKMAEKMHLSRSHFSISYKNIFGISPRDDLSEMIMKKAKHLLSQTDDRVSEIAEKCGYANTENFIRAFRKAFGVTPLAYRKKNR